MPADFAIRTFSAPYVPADRAGPRAAYRSGNNITPSSDLELEETP